MKSIHGVGELMTQVVLRGGGLLPTTPAHQPQGDVVKTQSEPEREDIMVMDTKLKIIEILQVGHREAPLLPVSLWPFRSDRDLCPPVHPERAAGLQDLLPALHLQARVRRESRASGRRCRSERSQQRRQPDARLDGRPRALSQQQKCKYPSADSL